MLQGWGVPEINKLTKDGRQENRDNSCKEIFGEWDISAI